MSTVLTDIHVARRVVTSKVCQVVEEIPDHFAPVREDLLAELWAYLPAVPEDHDPAVVEQLAQDINNAVQLFNAGKWNRGAHERIVDHLRSTLIDHVVAGEAVTFDTGTYILPPRGVYYCDQYAQVFNRLNQTDWLPNTISRRITRFLPGDISKATVQYDDGRGFTYYIVGDSTHAPAKSPEVTTGRADVPEQPPVPPDNPRPSEHVVQAVDQHLTRHHSDLLPWHQAIHDIVDPLLLVLPNHISADIAIATNIADVICSKVRCPGVITNPDDKWAYAEHGLRAAANYVHSVIRRHLRGSTVAVDGATVTVPMPGVYPVESLALVLNALNYTNYVTGKVIQRMIRPLIAAGRCSEARVCRGEEYYTVM